MNWKSTSVMVNPFYATLNRSDGYYEHAPWYIVSHDSQGRPYDPAHNNDNNGGIHASFVGVDLYRPATAAADAATTTTANNNTPVPAIIVSLRPRGVVVEVRHWSVVIIATCAILMVVQLMMTVATATHGWNHHLHRRFAIRSVFMIAIGMTSYMHLTHY